MGLAACATPSERFANRAAALGLRSETVPGKGFSHAVFANGAVGRGGPLHVYLAGDGIPWIAGLPARDPTPSDPLILHLMALDSAPSLFLGRPCYHDMAERDGCLGRLWTGARYSETVVASMAAALRRILKRRGDPTLVLIGHSGGGTLAMLLAARLEKTAAVVTIAANLDIDAWTRLHAYPPLNGSLDPVRQPPLAPGIYQIHYAGGRDRIVPAKIVRAGLKGNARLSVEPEYGHVCCWRTIWPRVLSRLARLKTLP